LNAKCLCDRQPLKNLPIAPGNFFTDIPRTLVRITLRIVNNLLLDINMKLIDDSS